MNKNPRVSVLMPVYNGERFLREAIDSILAQTFTDYEFIIIDDGSTDRTWEILTGYDDPRIRLVDNPANIGLTKSLNRGLELATGELVARMDADDISRPTRFEQQVRFLNAHPEVVLLGTGMQVIDAAGAFIPSTWVCPEHHQEIRWCLMFDSAFIHPSVMFRRKVVWEKLGGYHEYFNHSQDYDLWSRVACQCPVRNIADQLVFYRVHGDTMTTRNVAISDYESERIILENLRIFLRSDSIEPNWAVLINRLRSGVAPGRIHEPSRLIDVLDQVFARFYRLHPEVSSNPVIRRHLAEQFAKIAYWSASRNREASIRAYMSAWRLNAEAARRTPFLKYLALWLGGETVRQAYRRLAAG